MITFLENNVCDGSAFNLKWGTLVLYPKGFVFYYNRPRKDAPGRMQDVVRIGDVQKVEVEKIDWLVSKIFWVGRKKIVLTTKEGTKTYYLKKTDDLFSSIRMVDQSIKLTDTWKK